MSCRPASRRSNGRITPLDGTSEPFTCMRLQAAVEPEAKFLFYAFLCFVGVIAFVFLLIARELTLATLPSFIVALSNALGLVAITLFLGYGLVEVRCKQFC